MKSTLTLLFIFLVNSSWSATYTLDQCLDIGTKNNVSLLQSSEDRKSADSKVNEAYGNAYPTLSLQAKYEKIITSPNPLEDGGNSNPFPNAGRYIDQSSPDYDPAVAAFAGDLGNMLDFSSMFPSYQANVSLVVTQILFAQGKISTGLEIAKAYGANLKETHELLTEKIKIDISNSFYQVIYFREAVSIYQASIEQAKSHVKQVEALYKAGMVSEIDLLRASLKIEELNTGLDKMRRDLLLAKNKLLNDMGLSWNENVEFTGELSANQNLPLRENAVQRALNHRKELKQLDHAKKIQEELVTIEKAEYLPMIVAGGAVSKIGTGIEDDDYANLDWGNDARVFVQLEWNLFNGFQTREKVIQAKTEVRKLKMTKSHLEKGIQLQIEAAWSELDEAISRLKVQEKMISLSEKNQKMVDAAYSVGSATQLEVLDAEMETRKAKLNYNQAILDQILAINKVKMALGEF